MLKIFIAGCGRSGTTLMRHLFSSFDDCFIIKPESPFSVFEQYEEEIVRGNFGFAVAKRTAKTWKDLASIPDDIFVIAMVRHPFDVMTSYLKGSKNPEAFYIPPERWVNARAACSRKKKRWQEYDVRAL